MLGAGDNILMLLLNILLVMFCILVLSSSLGVNKLKGFFLLVDFLLFGLNLSFLNVKGSLDLSSVFTQSFFFEVRLFHLRSSGKAVGMSSRCILA